MNEVTTTDDKPRPQIATGGQLAGIAPQSIEEAFRLSQALARAGSMVPEQFKGKPDEIMAAVLRGAEIGLMPMQALSNIAVINGRASLWGDALPALIQKAGHHIDVTIDGEDEDMVATAVLTRKGGKAITRTFSVEDAKKARLWGKQGPWQQYPKRMLMHRARAWAVRDGAADALMGFQVAEEMEDAPPIRDVTPPAMRDGPNLAQQLQKEPEEKPDEPEQIDAEIVLTGDPESEAGEAGAAAWMEDVPFNKCPHEDGSQEQADWQAGWLKIEQENKEV